jgi:hypothetical protein
MTNRRSRLMVCLLLSGIALVFAACGSGTPSSITTGGVQLSITANGRSPGSGKYFDQQTINISVAANAVFKKFQGIEILECADPGGHSSSLPTSDASCDGDTVPATPVLINKNGSFSIRDYQIFKLPSAVMEEPPDSLPKCDSKNYCVLYIGQNQEDFTQPKIWSPPFLVETR